MKPLQKLESSKEQYLYWELKKKKAKDMWADLWEIKWKAKKNMSEEEKNKMLHACNLELDKSDQALNEIYTTYWEVKKAYLDLERKEDPFYVDYNLLFNNVDMLMALSYSNEMKVIFTWTDESDLDNADIISKTAEYDYREEMDMDLVEYELWMDKFIWWVGCAIRDWWNSITNAPIVSVGPVEHWRPDPNWRWHADKFRRHGLFGKMTKYQMKQIDWFFDLDQVTWTDRETDKTSTNNNNWTNVNLQPDQATDESALFVVYHHFRTMEDGRKCLCTLANGGKLLIRCLVLEYKIWSKRVFPLSLDYWKPKKGMPHGVRLYDLWARKQKVLSLLLNLAVKKSVRSSLGNHLVVDEKAVKNKAQLRQLTEFPEIILVDTDWGQKNTSNVVTELQRSQVPADNYNVQEMIKWLSYEETSIGPNQLWVSPQWNQTATEIKDNATNSNIRLSLSNRVSMWFYKDFRRKWLMMYQFHFPKNGKKTVAISREFGDKYLTFTNKYLNFSNDPHIKTVSKFDLEQKNKQQFSNHVVLHTYIQQLAAQPEIPLEVRLSMRKALRLMWYPEDEIIDYVKESVEEMEAKDQLRLLNNDIELEPLDPSQIDEKHEDYLHVYRQAKANKATQAAVWDRIRMLKERKKKEREQLLKATQQENNASNTVNWQANSMGNQMAANMIQQGNQTQPSLSDIQL